VTRNIMEEGDYILGLVIVEVCGLGVVSLVCEGRKMYVYSLVWKVL
jgi:hypothetical protein